MAKIWYVGPKTSSEHTTKWAPLGPLKPFIPRSTQRVRARILIAQPITVTLSVHGCLDGCLARGGKGRLQRVAHTFCTKRMVHNTNTAEVRARPCQVDNDGGRDARRYCYRSLGLALPSAHNSIAGRRVQRHCQLGMDVLELQQAWFKTYGATLRRRPLRASSRTTTKAAPHTQCDGYGLRYEYTGTHPSRTSRYEWL
jgi:hypothetical protein